MNSYLIEFHPQIVGTDGPKLVVPAAGFTLTPTGGIVFEDADGSALTAFTEFSKCSELATFAAIKTATAAWLADPDNQ